MGVSPEERVKSVLSEYRASVQDEVLDEGAWDRIRGRVGGSDRRNSRMGVAAAVAGAIGALVIALFLLVIVGGPEDSQYSTIAGTKAGGRLIYSSLAATGATASSDGIYEMDVKTRERRLLAPTGPFCSDRSDPLLSPSGRHVPICDGKKVWLLDLDSSEMERIELEEERLSPRGWSPGGDLIVGKNLGGGRLYSWSKKEGMREIYDVPDGRVILRAVPMSGKLVALEQACTGGAVCVRELLVFRLVDDGGEVEQRVAEAIPLVGLDGGDLLYLQLGSGGLGMLGVLQGEESAFVPMSTGARGTFVHAVESAEGRVAVSGCQSDDEGCLGIYEFEREGYGVRGIVNAGGSGMAWFPGGDHLAYEGDAGLRATTLSGESQLLVEGEDLRVVTVLGED